MKREELKPIKIGSSTYQYTEKGWIDATTKAKVPDGLLWILNSSINETEEKPKNQKPTAKKRLRMSTTVEPMSLGGKEFKYTQKLGWVDAKTKKPVDDKLQSTLNEKAGINKVVFSQMRSTGILADVITEQNIKQDVNQKKQKIIKRLSVDDVAKKAGLSKRTIQEMAQKGLIPSARKENNKWIFDSDKINNWIRARRRQGKSLPKPRIKKPKPFINPEQTSFDFGETEQKPQPSADENLTPEEPNFILIDDEIGYNQTEESPEETQNSFEFEDDAQNQEETVEQKKPKRVTPNKSKFVDFVKSLSELSDVVKNFINVCMSSYKPEMLNPNRINPDGSSSQESGESSSISASSMIGAGIAGLALYYMDDITNAIKKVASVFSDSFGFISDVFRGLSSGISKFRKLFNGGKMDNIPFSNDEEKEKATSENPWMVAGASSSSSRSTTNSTLTGSSNNKQSPKNQVASQPTNSPMSSKGSSSYITTKNGGVNIASRKNRGYQIPSSGIYTGLKLKSSESVGGKGGAKPATIEFAKIVQDNIPELERFSALNDRSHHSGKHPAGMAFDFSVTGGQSYEIAKRVKQLADQYGYNVWVLDEYAKPSKGATGGHIHVEVRSKTLGKRIKDNIIKPAKGAVLAVAKAASPIVNSGVDVVKTGFGEVLSAVNKISTFDTTYKPDNRKLNAIKESAKNRHKNKVENKEPNQTYINKQVAIITQQKNTSTKFNGTGIRTNYVSDYLRYFDLI